MEGRDDVAVGHRGLDVRRHAAPRRDERLELAPHAHERVGHRYDDLAPQVRLVLLGRRRRRVPRRRDDDEVAVGGADVVAVHQLVGELRPPLDEMVAGLHRPILRSRTDDDLEPDAGESGAEAAAGGARAAEDADAPEARAYAWDEREDPLRSPRMGLLEGKNIVVTGVLTDASLAFAVARVAQAEGAALILTGAGRGLSLTTRTARKLGAGVDVLELDVTVPEHIAGVREAVAERWDRVDGVMHAIAYGPPATLGDDFLGAQWDDVAVAVQVSAYSLKALADAFLPLMDRGGAFVGLDFDNRVARPAYNWMGVAKSALQSVSRYLAKELGPRGIRSNLVAAGPVRTMAAKSIPGFSKFEDIWDERAPLGWQINDPEPVAKACVALLSDWFPATTGEIVHVDGGFHAVGA